MAHAGPRTDSWVEAPKDRIRVGSMACQTGHSRMTSASWHLIWNGATRCLRWSFAVCAICSLVLTLGVKHASTSIHQRCIRASKLWGCHTIVGPDERIDQWRTLPRSMPNIVGTWDVNSTGERGSKDETRSMRSVIQRCWLGMRLSGVVTTKKGTLHPCDLSTITHRGIEHLALHLHQSARDSSHFRS